MSELSARDQAFGQDPPDESQQNSEAPCPPALHGFEAPVYRVEASINGVETPFEGFEASVMFA
jgi:hypothetical protein